MKKRELIDKIAEKTGMTKMESEQMLDALFQTLGDVLAAGDKIQIPGFGTFNTKVRPARSVRSPRNGEIIAVAEAAVPVLRPALALKERTNRPNTKQTT